VTLHTRVYELQRANGKGGEKGGVEIERQRKRGTKNTKTHYNERVVQSIREVCYYFKNVWLRGKGR
jgi:hypothetical protein